MKMSLWAKDILDEVTPPLILPLVRGGSGGVKLALVRPVFFYNM